MSGSTQNDSIRLELIAWIQRLDDQGLLKALHGLKKLKTVIVTFVGGVTDDGVSALQAAIPGVEVKR